MDLVQQDVYLATAMALVHWITFATLKPDDASVDQIRMEERVVSVNQVFGISHIVNDVSVMVMQITVTLEPELASIVAILPLVTIVIVVSKPFTVIQE